LEEGLNNYSILGLQLDEFACGHFRLKHPLTTLAQKGYRVQIVLAGRNNFTLNHIDLSQFTHVICQRQFEYTTLASLVRARERYGTVLLYEVDDNLHKVHPESHAYSVFKPGGIALKAHDTWVKTCDGLIVTTPDLAGHYSKLTNRIYVVQNYIDFHIRDWDTPIPRAESLAGKTVVGWAGGSTHAEDDEPLRGVLRGILRDYDDVVFALCSHPELMKLFAYRQEVPKEKVVFLDPVTFQQYPVVPAQFDIGIAPLRDTGFNRNKSCLKIMEYGARGVPYVASDIAPYRRFHKETNGIGGFLAETKTDWDVALRHLIEHPEARQKRGEEFETLIREQYNLESHIWEWEDVLEQSLDRNTVRIWESTEKPGRNAPCPCGSGVKTKRCCGRAFG
jgi:glycosyltransferase involved in cell wall biosynthesis